MNEFTQSILNILGKRSHSIKEFDAGYSHVIQIECNGLFLNIDEEMPTKSIGVCLSNKNGDYTADSMGVPITLLAEIEQGPRHFFAIEDLNSCSNRSERIAILLRIISEYALPYLDRERSFDDLLLFLRGFRLGKTYYYL